ncbi:MAG: M56 family metallopeptidase, partial [Gemmatimonadota bacterium]
MTDVLGAIQMESSSLMVLTLILKASVLLLVAGLATIALRRSSASARHLVWSAALVGVLALPFVSSAIPWDWNVLPEIAVPAAEPVAEPVSPPASNAKPASEAEALTESNELPGANDRMDAEITADAGAAAGGGEADGAGPDAGAVSSSPASGMSAAVVGLWVWLLVAAALLLRYLAGAVRLRSWLREADEIEDPALRTEIDQLQRRMGLRRIVRIMHSPAAKIPMLWGIWRPVVLLPSDAMSWSADRLRLVLRHELAHARRSDVAILA